MVPIEILLIEDNPGDIELTKEAFQAARIANSLNVVEDGEKAMEYLLNEGEFAEAKKPDLILLDLNLPKKNGAEVLEKMKNDVDLRRIPVVVLTTSDAGEDILRAYDNHANCYIRKPIDFQQFIEVVQKIEDFWLTVVKLPIS